MYTIKKAAHIVDELRIEDGEKSLVLNVNIYIDDIMEDFETRRAIIGKAQQQVAELKKSKTADAEQLNAATAALNEAVSALFSMIFGEEQTRELLDFYDGRPLTMLADFLPYITQVILPEIKKAQESLADKYRSWAR